MTSIFSLPEPVDHTPSRFPPTHVTWEETRITFHAYSQSFPGSMGTYTLNMLANGSTEVLDLCDNPAAATSFNFSTNISLANGPSIIPGVINVCMGETVTISPFSNNGTPSPMFNFMEMPL